MKQHLVTLSFAIIFASACAVALRTALVQSRCRSDEAGLAVKSEPTLLWRMQIKAAPNAPCAFPEGWFVTDESGGLTAISTEGRLLWHVDFSNQLFSCAASFVARLAVVASQDGDVSGVRSDTGKVVWHRKLDARFQHAPLTGTRDDVQVVWLMSQADGQLFCVRASDGQLVWQSEATNRCDGTPVLCRGRIAYGNCDGAVYVFDAKDGSLKGSVSVGENDQMAGGMLASQSGLLVTGTRQGNLVVVDADALKRVALVNVSPSETFASPAQVFGGLVAMGTPEGLVTFWRIEDKRLTPAGRVDLGKPVDSLQTSGGHLFALSGGDLCALSSVTAAVERLPLGDTAKGLVAGDKGALACVADGAIVSVRGEN